MKTELLKTGSNLVVKLLIALLVLSFAVWGIGDVFRGASGGGTVATAGDETITAPELERAVNQQVQQLSQTLGASPDELLRTMPIAPQVLEQLISQSLLAQEAKQGGMLVSEDMVIKEISSNPNFRNEDGSFNSAAFEGFLRSIGETQQGFVTQVQNGMAVRALLESLMANPQVPAPLAKRLFIHENEERTLALLRVPASYKVNVPQPTQADLVDFYEDHKQDYIVPETRNISFALVTAEPADTDLKISEEELQTAYEENIAEFTVPEQRSFKHMMFDSEEKANDAYQELEKGTDFDKVAKDKAGQDKDQTDIGKMGRADLINGMDAPLFALQKGELSKPLKSDLGWHIFRVEAVHPATTKALGDVKKDLKEQLIAQKKEDYLYNLMIRIQDALASGNNLKEVADVMGLKVQTIEGLTRAGKTAKGSVFYVPEVEGFLDSAFAAEEGGEAQLIESPDGTAYLLKVTSIVPQRTKALDEVRATVTEAWKKAAKEKALREVATNASIAIQKGESTLEKEAKKLGIEVKRTHKILRSNSGYNLKVPSALITEAFILKKPEDATAAYRAEDGSYVVAALEQIYPVPPLVEGKEFTAISRKLKQQIMDEAFSQLGSYLYSRYDVDINRKVLDQMYGQKQ